MRIGVSSGFMRFYHQVGVVVVAAQQLEANVVTFPHPERRYDFTFPEVLAFKRAILPVHVGKRVPMGGARDPTPSTHCSHSSLHPDQPFPSLQFVCKAGTKLRAASVSLHSSRPNIHVQTHNQYCDRLFVAQLPAKCQWKNGMGGCNSFTCDSCVLTIKDKQEEKDRREGLGNDRYPLHK